jgi:hypothetical protein
MDWLKKLLRRISKAGRIKPEEDTQELSQEAPPPARQSSNNDTGSAYGPEEHSEGPFRRTPSGRINTRR